MRQLLLVDGNSLTTACFHAIPMLNAPDGTPTNAVKGFMQSMFVLLEGFPSHVGVVFDKRGRLLRKDISEDYKSDRKPMNPDLAVQYPLVQEFIACLNIPMFADDGYEADDILAALADKFHEEIPIVIATRDRDLLQLCTYPNVTVRLMRSGGKFENYTQENAATVFGVPASAIALYKALAGDTSDRIKGVPGIGEKSAAELVNTYHTREQLVDAVTAGVVPRKYLTKLAGHMDEFETSFRLACFIERPIRIGLDGLERHPGDPLALGAFCDRLAINL